VGGAADNVCELAASKVSVQAASGTESHSFVVMDDPRKMGKDEGRSDSRGKNV